ncbi:stage III sporulation protein AH [Pontibacillus marinus BH030004 = DSM 16465]|uniref:Stage III sporulation protein AH n=2 Tax=Pontibacillus TaxID=289201 RepID=A0A0A5GES5_9BACI|nr:stage III sporulation protein AH [Pontibacillus marinus BH030004 = DSM 16465]
MLKKQTVWLLTMLSLMIVLSVYYMTSPDEGEVAFVDEDEQNQAENVNSSTENGTMTNGSVDYEGKEEVTSSLTSDQWFTAARLTIEQNRSERKEYLQEVMASGDVSAEEVNKAMNEINQLQEYSNKETLLEQTIAAKAEYPDVLVRAEDNQVRVTVKANELSKADTVEIMQLVYNEFGETNVMVNFQPYEENQ